MSRGAVRPSLRIFFATRNSLSLSLSDDLKTSTSARLRKRDTRMYIHTCIYTFLAKKYVRTYMHTHMYKYTCADAARERMTVCVRDRMYS